MFTYNTVGQDTLIVKILKSDFGNQL